MEKSNDLVSLQRFIDSLLDLNFEADRIATFPKCHLAAKVGELQHLDDGCVRYLNKTIKNLLKLHGKLVTDVGLLKLSDSVTQCGKLTLKVKIPDSLKDVIKKGLLGNYKPANDFKHKVSVVVKTPKPLDFTTVQDYLPYNDHRKFKVDSKNSEITETVFNDNVTDIHALLALIAVLKSYPCDDEKWYSFFWDAWLAVMIQWSMLVFNEVVFPHCWMTQVFDTERLVSFDNVKCLLLGQDPVSKENTSTNTNPYEATGIAFHGVGDKNPSVEGMTKKYGINCSKDEPINRCEEGKLLVNMIRTIGKSDPSVSRNSCRGAWVAYTLKLAFSVTTQNKPVIVFNNSKFPSAMTKLYLPQVCHGGYFERAEHPAYVNDASPDIQIVKNILAKLHVDPTKEDEKLAESFKKKLKI